MSVVVRKVVIAESRTVQARQGIDQVQRELGGLMRYMPWVAWPTLIGVLACAGLPPFGGFVFYAVRRPGII